jgi:hypothetical protein
MAPTCRYCMLDVCLRPCLKVRPGLRARCCLYIITQILQWAPNGSELRVLHVTCVCETLSQSQTWPQSQVLPTHNHTDLAVGPEWLRLARYCMVDVWEKPSLMVRQGLRASCCMYKITQTLQWAPNGSDSLGTVCLHVWARLRLMVNPKHD